MKKAVAALMLFATLLLSSCGLNNMFSRNQSASPSSGATPSSNRYGSPMASPQNTQTPLTSSELSYFTAYFEDPQNNGFLLSVDCKMKLNT